MSKTPFMPLWVADFLVKTTDLDAKETGAYLLILMSLWTHSGTLPNDPKKLQRIARCGREWPKVWGAISRYFTVTDETISQARLTEELQKVDTKREVNAHNGARGGRAKALKDKERALANATNSLYQPYPYPYNTEANASDAAASQAVDFTKEVFDRGVAFLGKYGTPEKQARALIGKWRQQAGDSETFNALRDANREGVTEPVSWITARLKPSAPDMDEIWKQVEAKQNGLS